MTIYSMVFDTFSKFFSMDGISYIVKSSYIYNLSWEDPAVDIKIYGPFKDKNISMITTGGDNVLDYLLEDPNVINSYDLNKHQNWLLELKIACIKCLNHMECLEIFGKGNGKLFRQKWKIIKSHLSEDAGKWWTANISIMDNFLFSGSISIIALFFWFFTRVLGMGSSLEKMNNERTMEYQLEVFKKYESSLLRLSYVADRLLYYCISFVGVPIRQYNMIETPNLITELVCYLFTKTNLAKDNYFYWGYIYGEWNEECCPRYLKEDNFEIVKERLDRIRIHTGYLGGLEFNNNEKSDVYILLDHMDWLDELSISKEINALIEIANPECKFCWRSASEGQPFGCLDIGNYEHSSQIGRLKPNLYSDRVGMYDSIHVARFDKMLLLPNEVNYESSFFKDLSTQFKMFTFPIKSYLCSNKSNKQLMNSFYENQVDEYDSFRSRMLHGKKEVVKMFPFEEGKSLHVLAGGTGDILEYMTNIVPKLKEVVVSDICSKLLGHCNKRVNLHNWTNVFIKEEDALKFNKDEKYDYVIITYSLTMIPNFELALDNAIRSLKPGGYLGIADFTLDNTQWKVTQYFWKTFFSFDNVNLNICHRDILSKKLSKVRVNLDYGSFPNMPYFIKCPYYYGLYQKN